MPPVAAVASSILAPGIGQVVGSIVGDIGANLLSGGGNTNPLNFLGGITDAFSKLFGQQQPSGSSLFPQIPLPFSPTAPLPFLNPFQALQNSLGLVKSVLPGLQNALGVVGGGGGFPQINQGAGAFGAIQGGGTNIPVRFAGASSAAGPDLAGSFGAPDSLMAQAQSLLQPGPDGQVSMANVLKAQQLMQQADMIFKTISKLMEMQFDAAKTALGAIRS